MKYVVTLLIILLSGFLSAQVSQVSINRIEQMPDSPTPYLMRNWHNVSIGYDNYVYDITKVGDGLPLVFINSSGSNYPDNKNFGLDTYVGTFSLNNGEAINVLPSLIGATLVGIDKSNQNSLNWVLMSQDFFNKRPEENIYLNNYTGQSGTDWWYDIMPNIYFYQLNDLYPDVGDNEFQFTSIADQWLAAVSAMGASDKPWIQPFMDYRAWSLSTMTPLNEGVPEPEAAGGISWLLYNAYIKTGDRDYLRGAEWSLEFLNGLTANPSYELQLPYGIYAAAKMNAQIGSSYDIGKMLNWTFDRGELRGWGAIVGNWNGIEASGLIGEANDQGNDYAFLMNGFQHAGALVPMVRYDKRFAHAIGKWMLNLANATRLFYPGFLPNDQQDASAWSSSNDPNGYIGYEGLREKIDGNPGPFSTGDAAAAGWATTNLALYGSSSVGIFGGIIKTTNVEKILQLNLLKTDYYREDAFPTYLYYNPNSSAESIDIDVGPLAVDFYDVLSETFMKQNVSGSTSFTLQGNDAVVLVIVPSGGTISYNLNKMLINGTIVDYMQTIQPYDYPPRIKSIAADDLIIEKNSSTRVYATAADTEGGTLTYSWSANEEPQIEATSILTWTAPETVGLYEISITVTDEQLNETNRSLQIEVVDHINSPVVIVELSANKSNINPGEIVEITCMAEDSDNDPLIYTWSVNGGAISGTGNIVNWQSPDLEGIYEVTVFVNDGVGGTVESTLNLMVRDYTVITPGNLIAYYPFSGNADDHGGKDLNGQVFGAILTEDFVGKSGNAFAFDGINDFIKVNNAAILNFSDAITVSCWIKPENLSSGKESFILSHGSWQNRWKLSLVAGKLRWTLKTSTSTKDVDSSFGLIENENYHVTGTFDGMTSLLYINGKLDSYQELSGSISQSPYDFLMGRMLPDDDNTFNYLGLIDEVTIHDYALTPEEVEKNIAKPIVTGVEKIIEKDVVEIFPNPTTGIVKISLAGSNRVEIVNVYNLVGEKIQLDLTGFEYDELTQLLNFRQFPNGVYYVHLVSQNKRYVLKILLVK